MLKNRAFLTGLGAGIIVGAMLFQLMLLGEQSRQNLEQIGNDSNEKLYTSAEVDALLKAERDSAQIDGQTKPDAVISDKNAVKDEDKTASADMEKDLKKPVQHVIRIEAGTGITDTAELLANHNIIQNKAAFINQMKESKKLVRAGYFLFQEGLSVEQAITIVTSKPITKK
jgi:hypothetical protein